LNVRRRFGGFSVVALAPEDRDLAFVAAGAESAEWPPFPLNLFQCVRIADTWRTDFACGWTLRRRESLITHCNRFDGSRVYISVPIDTFRTTTNAGKRSQTRVIGWISALLEDQP
jgi:hypothetical protein